MGRCFGANLDFVFKLGIRLLNVSGGVRHMDNARNAWGMQHSLPERVGWIPVHCLIGAGRPAGRAGEADSQASGNDKLFAG